VKIAVLTGGVGGAKFVLGLQSLGLGSNLTAIVNTGDDFVHLGLPVSPDIDSLLYALSGQDNKAQGWGRADESWSFMAALKSLSGPDWFNLGDGDLALHVLRGELRSQGQGLTQITAHFAQSWGIETRVIPVTDDPVATYLDTEIGELAFQNYFVEHQCRPMVSKVRYVGAEQASPSPGVIDAILSADVIFIAPSNPFLSVDPILTIPAVRQALATANAPVVCISPLVGGKAVKGPTAKLMTELGLALDNEAIARHYAPLIDAMVHDCGDAPPIALPSFATRTLMKSEADKAQLAREAMEFALGLHRK
jgi:LPPG:FO 2-phospho-L-lactate transferase